MTTDPKPPAPKPQPADIEVINPRYEGATFEMVVKAMLQRPKRPEPPDEPESGGAQSSTIIPKDKGGARRRRARG